MVKCFWLSEQQLDRIKSLLPRSHGAPRVDDRRVINGIVNVIRTGMKWCGAPSVYANRRRGGCAV